MTNIVIVPEEDGFAIHVRAGFAYIRFAVDRQTLVELRRAITEVVDK